MIEKKYQVFISSTFRDLLEERQATLKAVLELGHMPAGMELFPAADDSAWQLIRDVIDSSDYYVLLIGGRYGSLDEEGIGYTEKEYEYAASVKKPVVALLHENPDNLPREKTEADPAAWDLLGQFRAKVESKHTCLYWKSAEELKARVIISLTSNIKRHPRAGWVRADSVPSDATIREVLALREQVANLETELKSVRTDAPPGTEDLLQGEDTFEVEYSFKASGRQGGEYVALAYDAAISPSWDDIFSEVSPVLINEASEGQLRRTFRERFTEMAMRDLVEHDEVKSLELSRFEFLDSQIDTCLVQLRALGLIQESTKKRSVRDTSTYWTLTPYGDRLMVQLRALRRKPATRRIQRVEPVEVSRKQG